ncbi:hypothetical protein LCGC14_0963840 [marine sediment metagenome]|uniref:Uncharacterized protein n=1 Tax=marine sediment metagenome TaxID=412755 RepID=A0A0F9NZR1_9ZZZZ
MNKSQIAKALREAAFTPGKPGPLKVIADVGNINYYIRRATEFLTLSLTALTREQRVKYFDNALALTALAKVETQEQEKERRDFINPELGVPLPHITQTKEETEKTAFKVSQNWGGMMIYPKGTITQTKEETEEHRLKVTTNKVNKSSEDGCNSQDCVVSGICPGKDVLDAAKKTFGNNDDEVDKSEQTRKVYGTGNSVSPFSILGDVRDKDRSSESEGQVPEEVQPRPQDPFYPGTGSKTQH